jgi:hypothetical protein
MQSEDRGAKLVWQYLYLANYQEIVAKSGNWDLFKDKYDFVSKGKPIERVSWIGHLNKIRQTTHHPEKGEITKEDVEFVKATYVKVKEKILGEVNVPVPA